MTEEKIEGTIVRRCRDGYGEITIADKGDIRSLYFGNAVIQSSMLLAQPCALVEEYSRAMMSALIFRNPPESVLLIGLGGGSLVKFLLRFFPECAIDVVEIRQLVVDLARDFFLLPTENTNLKIYHSAGQDFVRQDRVSRKNYDLILVDAFDEDGPAAGLLDKLFLKACRQRLKEGGICVINLWNRPGDDFLGCYAAIKEAFSDNTLKLLLAESYQSAIVLCCDSPALFKDLPTYRPVARKLQNKHHLDFPRYLKYVSWQNYS